MAKNPVDKLKDKMAKASTTDSNAKSSSSAGGGSMGNTTDEARGEGTKDKDVAAGPKSLGEKQAVAEDKINRAKAEDTEDTREETSGDERHDLVSGKELNIPPTIVAERLRLGQNPSTGEPWTREERMKYDRDQEQGRQAHAKAVRESEEKMRKEQAESKTPVQPSPHVPVSTLTETQKKAMQEAQDAGKGPIAQATARDQNSPEEIGKREAEASSMTKEESGVDKDTEREELERVEREEEAKDKEDEPKDADEVQKDLDEKRNQS